MPTSTATSTVLVVDDVPEIRSLLSTALTGEGYSVLVACDAMQARDICAQYPDPIHLLVTDVLMPGMNGPALAAYAQSIRPQIRVLYISAYDQGLLMDRLNLDQGTPFLMKPFSPDELLRKIRDVLAASR
jgi:two-component system, cell cycle sensor histidine kinase and response regulator CckA